MLPSSHVFSFHGSMVCFRLNILPSLASVRDFFCFLRRCCCRLLLLFQPGKCATSRPRDEYGHLQVRQISVEHNARFGLLCRCACWFLLHRSCTFKKRISRIMPRRVAWCRAASPPGAAVLGQATPYRPCPVFAPRLCPLLGRLCRIFHLQARCWCSNLDARSPPVFTLAASSAHHIKNKSYQRNTDKALSHKRLQLLLWRHGLRHSRCWLGFAPARGETTEPFPLHQAQRAAPPPGTQPA